jgi:pimeloyl-ACP methyl ester carboxylesterase
MPQTIAGLLTDHYPPESAKFKSPLLLVHGLWSGSSCWHSWATHFCNLGWDCLAINLRGRFGQNPFEDLRRLNFDKCVEDLRTVVKSLAFPPVVLGLNLGAAVALRAAETTKAAALILVSPAPLRDVDAPRSRSQRLLRLKYLPLIYLRRPFRIDEKDFADYFLTGLAKGLQQQIFQRTVPESSFLVREFFAPSASLNRDSLNCPILILAGAADQICPPAATRDIALWLGADGKEYAAQGHWLLEQDSEAMVRDIHRWLVQKLGDEILLADIM